MNRNIIVHRFKVELCCKLDERERIYYDDGVILLPSTYTESGDATRLVINCHGAGGTVETDDSQVEQQILTKYLLVNGYAVMDVNGLPRDFARIEGIDVRNNIGSPIAVQSYVKAYDYCISHFNLKRELLIHGSSMGGISSTNLVLSRRIPIIAQSGFCPVLDTLEQIFLNPWSSGLPKTALGKIYCLEVDENGEYVYDEERLSGYNPMGRCFSKGNKEYLSYPVPVKFWQCEDDETVGIDTTKRFVEAVNNAEGCAYLRTFKRGGHEPQDCGEFVQSPVGNTAFNGETLHIKPAVEEAFVWLSSFDK